MRDTPYMSNHTGFCCKFLGIVPSQTSFCPYYVYKCIGSDRGFLATRNLNRDIAEVSFGKRWLLRDLDSMSRRYKTYARKIKIWNTLYDLIRFE